MVSLALIPLLGAMICPVELKQPPEVAAIPTWPSDGRMAKALDENEVFRDPQTEAIVVAYPPESGQVSEGSSNITTRREYFRFHLNNRVAPVVSSSVSRNREGQYVYMYQVENCPEAKTPIRMWSVAGPPVEAPDPKFQSSHPSWGAYPRPRVNAARQALLPHVPPGPFISWEKWEDPIPAGSQVAGFQVTSGFRPGFTTAFVAGDGGLVTPGGTSEITDNQLLPLQKPEVTRRTTLTIGPRFAPEVSNLEVAAAFLQDLEALTRDQWLDGQSPFIESLLEGLRSYIESRGGSELTLQASPQGRFEMEIAAAVRLSISGAYEGR